MIADRAEPVGARHYDLGAPDMFLGRVPVGDEGFEPLAVSLAKSDGYSCAHDPDCHTQMVEWNARRDSSVSVYPLAGPEFGFNSSRHRGCRFGECPSYQAPPIEAYDMSLQLATERRQSTRESVMY